MTTTTALPRYASTGDRAADDGAKPIRFAFEPGFSGLRCSACGTPAESGARFACARCFGPLEPIYDYERAARTLTRDALAERGSSIWRWAELLPVESPPAPALAVGGSPLVEAPRLAREIGVRRAWVKDDSRNPTLSFKDRVVGVAAARAHEFGFTTLACASTGNLAAAVAAAAARYGLQAVVFVPSDLEPAKTAQAAALGATVVPIDAPYDAVNRLCLELTDELPDWAVLNVKLRPYYAEGSKTIGFEVVEQLGWRAPDVIVGPIASGSMFTKIAQGVEELARVGLIEPAATRFVGGQASGCGPVAAAFASGGPIEPVEQPTTIVRSLAIGTPSDGERAITVARQSGGSIEGNDDAAVLDAVRLLATTEGILTEPAGGVTVAALRSAVAAGRVTADDEAVLVISGNGLKTLDALPSAERAPILPASFDAFIEWWEHEAAQPRAASSGS
jgi:threonine synthase